MAQTDGTVQLGQTIVAVPSELNKDGQPVQIIPANIQWTVADPGVATVQAQGDGSGLFTPVAAGTTTVTVTDTQFSLSAQGTLTVTGGVDNIPVSITFAWQAAQ